MAGSKLKTKIWRCTSKTKKIMVRFLGHTIVRDIFGFLLMLGIFYFTIAGILTLALRTDSFWMSVISPSMKHNGEAWRDYFIDHGYDPSEFPIQGGFERGDLLIIRGVYSVSEIAIGDVIIIDLGSGVIPLTHRVVDMWEEDGEVRIMTKGDANSGTLQIEKSIKPEQITGEVVSVIPKLGYISLWFQGQ